jgi:RNA methyltransferase, TrmH family
LIVLSSVSNPRVKAIHHWLTGGESPSSGLLPVEGVKLAREALASGLPVVEAWLSSEKAERGAIRQMARELEARHLPVTYVTEQVFRFFSGTESPQGILLIVRPAAFQWESLMAHDVLLLVACEIQDPGNLGTILRSAEAFGVEAVAVTTGSVSTGSAKLMRSSAGALLRLPILSGHSAGELMTTLTDSGFRHLAAAGRGELDFRQACFLGKTALWVGNEGRGLPEALLTAAESRITIPLAATAESLNVAMAASIILCEAARQRTLSRQQALKINSKQ